MAGPEANANTLPDDQEVEHPAFGGQVRRPTYSQACRSRSRSETNESRRIFSTMRESNTACTIGGGQSNERTARCRFPCGPQPNLKCAYRAPRCHASNIVRMLIPAQTPRSSAPMSLRREDKSSYREANGLALPIVSARCALIRRQRFPGTKKITEDTAFAAQRRCADVETASGN